MKAISVRKFQVSGLVKRHPRFFKLLFAASLALLLCGLTAFFFPQRVLTMDSGPVKADVLVVLGGGAWERPQRAAELFKQGEAPKILVSGFGDAAAYASSLTNSGVPLADILLEGKSTTTRENAEFSIPLLRQMGAHRVIIVTSWYHSRRALACFEHYAPDLKFYSRPSYADYPKTEWNHHGISGYIKSEYVKLLGYWVCYGVWPL